MGMEGGRRRCITEKAVDLHNVSNVFASRCSFKHFFTCRVTSTCEKVLETAARSKTILDTLWKVNGTTAITCKKTRENMSLCTHATQHSTHGPHTVFFSLLSPLVFPLSLFFCPPSPCDVVCDVMLCCVWECMWCLWCGLWCNVIKNHGVCLVCVWVWCVPRRVLTCSREVHQRNRWILPISSLRTGRTRHVPDSFNHSLYLIRTVQLQLQ